MKNSNEKVRELQLAEAELIKEFVDICDKEQLRYFMLCGTMLGAVRHKGYIPWDDDADFGMPRPDYERFIACAPQYLPKHFILESIETKEDHTKYFVKLSRVDKQVRLLGRSKASTINVWIDISPLDGIPGNIFDRKIHQMKLLILRKLFTLSVFEYEVQLQDPKRAWYNRLGTFICRYVPFYKAINKNVCWKALDKLLKKYAYDESPYLVNFMGAYKFVEMFKKEVFGDGSLYEFECLQLRGPVDYNSYLQQLYGKYMELPPVEQRDRHGIEIINGNAS